MSITSHNFFFDFRRFSLDNGSVVHMVYGPPVLCLESIWDHISDQSTIRRRTRSIVISERIQAGVASVLLIGIGSSPGSPHNTVYANYLRSSLLYR